MGWAHRPFQGKCLSGSGLNGCTGKRCGGQRVVGCCLTRRCLPGTSFGTTNISYYFSCKGDLEPNVQPTCTTS